MMVDMVSLWMMITYRAYAPHAMLVNQVRRRIVAKLLKIIKDPSLLLSVRLRKRQLLKNKDVRDMLEEVAIMAGLQRQNEILRGAQAVEANEIVEEFIKLKKG